ncbi:MAG: hypothetical protein SVR08_01065 [Spirochaetota bacterium]|nr:hypothetical protein [Spirochaetota bacterium]
MRLAIIYKKDYYFFFLLTFILLILSFPARWWWQKMELGGFKLYWYLNMSAWFTSVIAFIIIIRSKYRKWKDNHDRL